MASTLVVRAPGDGWTYVPGEGDVPDPGEVIYEGPGVIQRAPRGQAVVVSGGQQLAAAEYVGRVPWHVAGMQPGHTIEATECDDPALVGVTFAVEDVELNGLALTARRFTATRAEGVQHG